MQYIENTRTYINKYNINKISNKPFINYPFIKNYKTALKINRAMYEDYQVSILDDCISYNINGLDM